MKPLLLLGILLAVIVCGSQVFAEPGDSYADSGSSERWWDEIQTEWGGYARARGFVTWPDDDSFFRPVGIETLHDRNVQLRLNNRVYFGTWGYLESHYEALVSSGDTREKIEELRALSPVPFPDELLPGQPLSDERRLMDLTSTVEEGDSYFVSHRLDRLNLTLRPEWGTVRIGRQIVTWGNGFLFNPMDLFNPFAPTDIERDYKIGDDMITTQLPVEKLGDFQFLYVPRRDPDDGDVKWDESSLAAKLHFPVNTTEFDVLAASHFGDFVGGVGAVGYLGAAAWRADATLTIADGSVKRDEYVSFVANMDYSWVWWDKNFYGFIEVFFNGIGEDAPDEAFTNPELIERLERGDLFVVGRAYLDGTVQVELHPLVNLLVTTINNLNDPSGIVQPRVVWDFAQDFELVVGASIGYGEEGTEFGGFKLPGTDLLTQSPRNAFAYVSYYF
ncbi:MAG: hypothetical protein Kow0099_23800 [Candidatus Abyssubacteria bacterium]